MKYLSSLFYKCIAYQNVGRQLMETFQVILVFLIIIKFTLLFGREVVASPDLLWRLNLSK